MFNSAFGYNFRRLAACLPFARFVSVADRDPAKSRSGSSHSICLMAPYFTARRYRCARHRIVDPSAARMLGAGLSRQQVRLVLTTGQQGALDGALDGAIAAVDAGAFDGSIAPVHPAHQDQHVAPVGIGGAVVSTANQDVALSFSVSSRCRLSQRGDRDRSPLHGRTPAYSSCRLRCFTYAAGLIDHNAHEHRSAPCR